MNEIIQHDQILSRDFPPSQVGQLASQLVETLNTGNRDKMVSFLESRLSKLGKEEKAVSEYLVLLQKVYEQSGGVEARKVERSEPNPFVFDVKSKHGEHWTRIFLFLDKIEQGKIASFGFLPLLGSPEEELPWPKKRGSETDVAKEIQRQVRRDGEKDAFSGVVLVAGGGRVLVNMATGLAEKSFSAPNMVDTKFNIGSMNKMFTSISIAQLMERGKLSLQGKLGEVLPDYPNKDAADKITIFHLLTHSAGLGGLFERTSYDNRRRYKTSSDYFPVFASDPLRFEPGSRSSYSNEGYIVLGAIIEKISGENYHDYVRKHIFDRVGMPDTGPFALDDSISNLAVGYMRFEDDPFGVEPRHPNYMFLGWRGNACGGGYSTAPDLLRFANALKTYDLVSKELTDEFTKHQGPMRNYGFGFEVEDFHGKRVVGHTGGGPNSGVNSALKILWDEPYSVIVLGNYDAPIAQNLASDISLFLAS